MQAGDSGMECVFCTRRDQPAALYEGAHLYIMPDKFPLVPGHTLVISKVHLPCFAAATEAVWQELEAAIATVRAFLEASYGDQVQIWENGVAGQTVLHAHLHLLPAPRGAAPAELIAHADVSPVDGWQPVREHYRRHGSYRYAGFGPARYLIAGRSSALAALRGYWQSELGLRWSGEDWIRDTAPGDVLEVCRRWSLWQAHAADQGLSAD